MNVRVSAGVLTFLHLCWDGRSCSHPRWQKPGDLLFLSVVLVQTEQTLLGWSRGRVHQPFEEGKQVRWVNQIITPAL